MSRHYPLPSKEERRAEFERWAELHPDHAARWRPVLFPPETPKPPERDKEILLFPSRAHCERLIEAALRQARPGRQGS